MGCIPRRKQSIEKAVEFAFTHVTNITNPHRVMPYLRTRLPQGMTKGSMCGRKPVTIYIVVRHRGSVNAGFDILPAQVRGI
jgi:hypothetical protein